MASTVVVSSDEKNFIHLISKDEKTFVVDLEAAKKSAVIFRLIDDMNIDLSTGPASIPLPNVDSKELKAIVDFLENHKTDVINIKEWHENLVKNEVSPFDKNLMKMDTDSLTDIAMASNFMDIAPLSELIAWAISQEIKNCETPEEIVSKFHEECDFTANEKQAIQKEYEWYPKKI